MTDQDLITPPGPADLFCPRCGYNLRGIESNKCPECGIEVDRAALAESVIPWTRRAKIGRVRAFIHTVWLVTWHPARLARDAARPVSYRDAQLFRWIVVVLLALPACGWTYYTATHHDEELLSWPAEIWNSIYSDELPPWYLDPILCWIKGIFCLPIPVAAAFLIILAWTGLASYFFHPAGMHVVRQNRAIALSLYTCAPLVWLLVPIGLCMLILYSDLYVRNARLNDPLPGDVSPIRANLVPVFLIWSLLITGSWLFSTLRGLARTTDASIAKLLMLTVALPMLFISIAIMLAAILPIIGGFFRLVIESYGA